MAAMRHDLQQGHYSAEELSKLTERRLEARYGACRQVVRKARNAVLAELEALNSRQIPTNDN
jgi:hypothetical protein